MSLPNNIGWPHTCMPPHCGADTTSSEVRVSLKPCITFAFLVVSTFFQAAVHGPNAKRIRADLSLLVLSSIILSQRIIRMFVTGIFQILSRCFFVSATGFWVSRWTGLIGLGRANVGFWNVGYLLVLGCCAAMTGACLLQVIPYAWARAWGLVYSGYWISC